MTGTSSGNHRKKTFEFEEFEGRYIKLFTTEAPKEITIWEIGLYFDAEKSDSGNVASGKTATASTIKSEEYKADNVTDNSNTTFWKPGDGDTTPNIMIDLEKIVPINYIRILEEKDNISKLHIEYSTDNLVWTTAKDAVCSATGAVSNRDSRIEFPAINARYVKITVSESIAPASIGNIRIACARSCDTFWYYKAASAINESVITSEKLDEITADINKGLITHIDNANYSADIEWTSSDETVVNVLTGVVNRSNIDQNVTLTAKITMGGVASAAPVNIKTFDLTVKATEPSETLLGFDVPELKNRIKNVENGSVLEENGEFKIKSNADSVGTTKFDLAKIKKFDINSSFCAEIELTNKNFTENKIYFKNGENEIISIAFTPEKYTIFYGEKGKPIQTEINEAVQDKKIKLELWFDFEKNTFDVYEKNDEGYRHIIINKPILTEEN
ncbi:MAG: discoidin domain-containing protein, partial [Oscillospiraceae bacterium]